MSRIGNAPILIPEGVTVLVTGDDVKIYTLEDLDTQQKFRFAIRGCVLATPA